MFFEWFRFRRKNEKPKTDYDFLPLFFWDKGLSNTAKVIMCLAGGGQANRQKSLERLKQSFPEEAVDGIQAAIEQLERLGYLTCEQYKGEYGETRVDHRLCICPNQRLPKLVQPTGAPLECTRTAVTMYDKARDLGFIAETGVATTYLLYDALRIFTAVENILSQGEQVILPLIGTETIRDNTDPQMMTDYPQAIVAAVVTTDRVIFVQEDSDVEGRRAGLARLICRSFCEIKEVALDEHCSRVIFQAYVGENWGGRIQIDLLTPFALDRFETYYKQMLALLPNGTELPRLAFFHETIIHDD